MRTAIGGELRHCLLALAATAVVADLGHGACAAEPAAARRQAILTSEPAAPSILGRGLRSASSDRPVQSRRPVQRGPVIQAAAASDDTDNSPPVPMEPDAPAAPASSPTPAPSSSPAVVSGPPVPFLPPMGNRSAFHNRLWAKRLARVQQMKQSAEQSGDAQGAQRAQYLEGMVNQLHQQGLFNFAQKIIGAMQEGKLNGAAAEAASSTTTELPDADLGEAAPLPGADLGESAPIPGTDLGTPAPLPTDDTPASPQTPSDTPSNASDDGGDAPPAE